MYMYIYGYIHTYINTYFHLEYIVLCYIYIYAFGNRRYVMSKLYPSPDEETVIKEIKSVE